VGLRYENIDLEAAKKARVPVCVARKLGRIQIAEHAFTLMLTLRRKILPAHSGVIQCDYEKMGIRPIVADQTHFLPNWFGYDGITTLFGQTLGILGMGEIGTEVALHGKAFGMSMLYYQRHRIDPQAESELGVKYVGFEELLRQADILTVCIPQTPQTEKMISARGLSLMKRSSYLINIAKGAIVDEEALAQALQAGAIAGAGLDVFGQEPLPKGHPLLQCPNVVLTPHLAMGVAAGGNVEEEIKLTFSHVRRVLEGLEPEGRIV
jgi:phosphoglycerate dehydrogenase-like enzyme